MSAVGGGERNLAWADAFVAGLTAAGLTHVVLAPGARSAPLAVACLRRRELVCEVVNDERAAAYFALGLARETRRAAAVLCTSGTAAANLLPAIMEARLAGVPLLALTADRPPEAQGWGGNQTADQLRLFGDHVVAFHAAAVADAAVADGYLAALAARVMDESRAGPVHVNLPFREPLLPERIGPPPPLPIRPAAVPAAAATASVPTAAVAAATASARVAAATAVAEARLLAERIEGRRGVVVCGEGPWSAGFAPALAALAARLDVPVLAEALSNLRYGAHDRSRILAHQARFLRAAMPAPDWVLRFGAFPVSRTLERWLAGLGDAQHLLVARPGHWPDPLWRHDWLSRTDPLALVEALTAQVSPATGDGCAAWIEAEAGAAAAAARACGELFEGTVARTLIAAAPAGARLFVGNSLAIRAVDGFGGGRGQALTLHGNRGASGIDGNIATAAGIAAASGAPCALLLGDQAALHDCGSLACLAGRDVVAVVMDNGGGGIFDHLPLAQALPDEMLRRGWTAPPSVDFAALAAAFGLSGATVATAEALRPALDKAFAAGGAWLLRVVIDRAQSRRLFAG